MAQILRLFCFIIVVEAADAWEEEEIKIVENLKPNVAAITCGIPLSDSIANDSVSPITKSTHRMSKAMQVSQIHSNKNLEMIITYSNTESHISSGIDYDATVQKAGYNWCIT